MECPECKSTNIGKYGKVWNKRKKVQRYICNTCGKYFTIPEDDNLVAIRISASTQTRIQELQKEHNLPDFESTVLYVLDCLDKNNPSSEDPIILDSIHREKFGVPVPERKNLKPLCSICNVNEATLPMPNVGNPEEPAICETCAKELDGKPENIVEKW